MRARLLDQLNIHIAHQVIGDGVRLFERTGAFDLQKVKVVESDAVTHIRFRIV